MHHQGTETTADIQFDLLVTTARRILLVSYFVPTQSWKTRTVLGSYGQFYGCDWDAKHMYVGARDDLTSTIAFPFGEVIARLDRGLRFKDVWYRTRQIRDLHQICVVGRKLWITNPYYNLIKIVDLDTRLEQDFAPNARHSTIPGSDTADDWNHFNSIRFDGEKVYLVASNALRPGNANIRSEVFEVDPSPPRVIRRRRLNAYTAHDIWKEAGEFRTCESSEGSIEGELDRSRGWRLKLEPWLRGVAIHDRWLFAGRSIRASRSERPWSDGEILLIDRISQNALSQLPLKDTGQILDMCLLNVPDLCRFERKPFREKAIRWG